MRCSSDKRSGKGGASSIVPSAAVHRPTGGARKPLGSKRGTCSTHARTLHFLPCHLALGWFSPPPDQDCVCGNTVSSIAQTIGEDPHNARHRKCGEMDDLAKELSGRRASPFSPADSRPESIGEREVISPLNRICAATLLLVAWSVLPLDVNLPAKVSHRLSFGGQ